MGRGRPSTGGRRDGVLVRFEREQIDALDAWIARQPAPPSRPEAIRRLVELGLGKPVPTITVTSTANASSERAREMAGNTIDKLKDAKASPDDQINRKRRLVKGPEEFQNVRRDRPNRK